MPFQKSAGDPVSFSGHWTAPHIKGKLGHNRNSKLAGQCALFSFSNLTAVPIEFVMQESSKMICKKSGQHHTLLKRQIRAFLQTDLKKQILNILRTGCTISSPNIQIFSEWARPGQCSQHQVFSKYSIWKYFRSNKQKTKTKRMRLVQALVAECQLCSYFVQLHRIHYKRRTLNLQIKHRQCWFNNFESTCSLLNCRLQFLCPSCISLMF